ncbi:MAG: CBS domain-containing protein [Myxococcales bacterium]|nr:CBS domain-containing protein [Myxococcales bacterium]MCB9752669.1 CBS domain-containing protein [Myxococcales bacterium]
MTSRPETASLSDRVSDSFSQMRQKGIRHLPVVDESGTLVGIISDRDLLPYISVGAAPRRQNGASAVRVREIMTRSVEVVGPDDTLRVAVELFLEHRFGALPVVNASGRLVGILSLIDVFRAWYELSGGARRES